MSRPTPAFVVALLQSTPGNYLGTFMVAETQRAQYLRLGHDGNGAFYDGLRWIRICQVTSQADTISFSSARLFGRIFAFSGQRNGTELRGKLLGYARPRDPVLFRRLDDASGDEVKPAHTGLYSDLQYVHEAGDVVGTELFVGTVSGKLIVALAMAEGEPARPIVGLHLTESGDTLRFDLSSDRAWPTATAVFADSTVALTLSDAAHGPQVLLRRFSALQFFRQPSVGQCR